MSNYIKVGSSSTGWQRPADWLPIPSVGANEEVAYLLHAVWDTTVNPVALLCTGNYTVDWGDGTVTNYASNVVAERNYVYSSISSDVTARGYKTVLIKITPQSGASISKIDLTNRHSSYNYRYLSGILQFVDNFSNANQLYTGSNLYFNLIESIEVKYYKGGIYDYNIFGMGSLKYLKIATINSGINVNAMFNGAKIRIFDIPKTLSGTYTNLFDGMESIEDLSDYTVTTAVPSVTFFNCYCLKKYPVVTGLPTSANSIFYNNRSLKIIPAYNFSNVTSIGNWLYGVDRQVTRSLIIGLKITHTYANQLLDATALNEIFTNLGTANAGATITITGNPGAGSCTQSIATTKGWTVIN